MLGIMMLGEEWWVGMYASVCCCPVKGALGNPGRADRLRGGGWSYASIQSLSSMSCSPPGAAH